MAFRISTTTGLVLATLAQKCQASTPFFATDADPFLGQVVASRSCIISDFEAALQNSSLKETDDGVEVDLRKVEDRLRPIFHALPKNKYDRLSSAGVRYLLHRHFVHHRAWLVTGVAPDGKAWGEDFPMETLALWAPDGLQTVVADHLNGRGLTLRECAVMATMLENQVHAEATAVLSSVWKFHALGQQDAISSALMHEILEDFMLVYLFLTETKNEVNGTTMKNARYAAEVGYPGWPGAQQFLWDVQARTTSGETTDGFSFAVAEQIVMRVIHQWGTWQEAECRTLKRDLLQMEGKRPGRVDLTEFHASAAFGRRDDFMETAAYLRKLGILDESVPSRPEVIIPNYIHSPTNYLASGNLFAIACINECEDLLSHIERRVGGPTATPDQLAVIVRSLPSVESEQVIVSDTLMQQLRQVAALHGGRVPLHGRLFALWMHHAYPRDCQYPAQGGTTTQELPLEYEASTGLSAAETPDELAREAQSLAERSREEVEISAALPWDLEEELLQEPLPDDTFLRLSVAMAAILATVSAGIAAARVQPAGMSSATKIVV